MSHTLTVKARDILLACSYGTAEARKAHLTALSLRYGQGALTRAMLRLSEDGYLHYGAWPWASWLTDQGRHALESSPMVA